MSEASNRTVTDRFEVRVTADSHFAWLRTRMALERTMMAWMRTAVSLIGFGFAIVQFFNHLSQMPGTEAQLPKAPYYLGLCLIGCGPGAPIPGRNPLAARARQRCAHWDKPQTSSSQARLHQERGLRLE